MIAAYGIGAVQAPMIEKATSSMLLGGFEAHLPAVNPQAPTTVVMLELIRRDDTDTTTLLLGAIAGGAVVHLAPTAVGWVMGISPSGPTKGGLFARWQSKTGNILGGSVIAQTQSFVMKGASGKCIILGMASGGMLHTT